MEDSGVRLNVIGGLETGADPRTLLVGLLHEGRSVMRIVRRSSSSARFDCTPGNLIGPLHAVI